MTQKEYAIKNEMGLHMRPAGVLAKSLGKFKSEISITCNGNSFNGKSVLNLMAACIKTGDTINVSADGEDEKEVFEKIDELYAQNFGEPR